MATDRDEIDTRGLARRLLPAAFGACTVDEAGMVRCPPVEFAAVLADTVTRDVILYRMGSESWRGTTVTPAELKRAVGRVRTPRPLRYPPSVVLESVKLGEGGRALVGTVTMPTALDDEYHQRRRGFRCEWDAETKDLLAVDLIERGRMTDPIDAPEATFARTERNAMSYQTETDEAYAKRVNAKYNGNNRIAREAKEQNDAYYAGRNRTAEFATGTAEETAEEYAARVVARHGGRRAAPSPSPAPAPPSFVLPWGFSPPPPIRATAEADGAFLDRLAQAYGGPKAAAAALRTEAAALPGKASSLAQTFNINWPAAVQHLGEPAARLEAMARALETARPGKAISYTAPSADEIAEASGRLIARVAVSKGVTAARLMEATRDRFLRLHAGEAQVGREVDALFLPSAVASAGVDDLRAKYHRTAEVVAGAPAERARIVAFRAAFPAALASAVAQALDAAGGRASVASDLSDVHVIAATVTDPDEGELSEVKGRLRALGADATGRAAQSLQTRHDELASAIERRRSEARAKAAERAEADLEGALSGDPDAVKRLADLVSGHRASFAEGLGKALADAPRQALEEAGHGALAGIVL